MNIPWTDNDSDVWNDSQSTLTMLHHKWRTLATDLALHDPALTDVIEEMGGPEKFHQHLSQHLDIFTGIPDDVSTQEKSRQIGYAHIRHHVPPSAYVTLYNALFTSYHALSDEEISHLPPMMVLRMRWLRDMATVLDTYMATMDQTMAELHLRATTDALTGLLNRRGLMDQMATSAHPSGAFILFDIDSFKEVNDHRGHPAGDAVLEAIAHQLNHNISDQHLVARLGGDEFLWWWPTDPSRETILQALESLQEVISTRYGVTVSFGVAFAPRNGEDFDTLYKAADEALYQAKRRAPKERRTREHAIVMLTEAPKMSF